MDAPTENFEPSDNPADYQLLKAYQIYHDVMPHYWKKMQVQAAADKAPRDAIYFHRQKGWQTLRDCEPEFQQRLKDYLANLANEIVAASQRYMAAVSHAKQFGYARSYW
jgi:hypothetical protein